MVSVLCFIYPKPRQCHVSVLLLSSLTSQPLVRQSLSTAAAHNRLEPSAITLLIFAFVVPECLLVKVAEQMKRFHGNIGSFQRAFQQAPEVLHAVRMDMALDVLDGMIDNFMDELGIQSFIRF